MFLPYVHIRLRLNRIPLSVVCCCRAVTGLGIRSRWGADFVQSGLVCHPRGS
uniref:Uncharacterized protein n=1 Tax=Anguilla anguilla TaxID=7936 RepID=A0A0E9RZZ3_ANGAN